MSKVVQFFKEQLSYDYYADWQDREGNANIETEYLSQWLKKQGVNDSAISLAIRELKRAVGMGGGKKIYQANTALKKILLKDLEKVEA